jgi:hypothetical protein
MNILVYEVAVKKYSVKGESSVPPRLSIATASIPGI